MAKTERVLGGVIVTGIVACIGLIAWPMGPRSATALSLQNPPVEPPAARPEQASAEPLDPLTDSVVHGAAARQSRGLLAVRAGAPDSAPLNLLTLENVGDAHQVAVGEVLLSRLNTATSEPRLIADFDGDAELTDGDTDQFQQLWETGDPKADLNGDGEIDASDFAAFVDAFDGQARTPGVENMIRLHFVTTSGELQSGSGSGRFEIQLGSQVEFTLDRLTVPLE